MKFGGCSFGFGDGLFVYMLWGEEHFELWLEGSSIFIMFVVDCSNLWFPPHLLQLEAEIETLLDELRLNREPYVMYVYAMRRNVPLRSSISNTKDHWSESAPQLQSGMSGREQPSIHRNCQADILCPQESKYVCQE